MLRFAAIMLFALPAVAAAPKKPFHPFVTVNDCKVVKQIHYFTGHDGVVTSSPKSCTEAFVRWANSKPVVQPNK